MTREQMLALCVSLTGAVEEFPFGDGVAVFKVGGKVFAMVPVDDSASSVTLKCDPDLALELRARHAAVRPGYHTNKRHWNTVDLDGTIPDDEVEDMVTHSHALVVSRLPKSERARLQG